MYGKIEITGTITVLTGMHIGDSNAFSAIGAVDSPVVKDKLTGNPMLPGSSLKGKMRSLLARRYNTNFAKSADEDNPSILALFGSSKKDNVQMGRILFTDSYMENWEELHDRGLESRTEVKFENFINRATAVANPRQIERVVRGSRFPFRLIYEVGKKREGTGFVALTEEDIEADMKMIKEGINLLEADYIGGSGSRGYGRIEFSNLNAAVIVGDVEDSVADIVKNILCGE